MQIQSNKLILILVPGGHTQAPPPLPELPLVSPDWLATGATVVSVPVTMFTLVNVSVRVGYIDVDRLVEVGMETVLVVVAQPKRPQLTILVVDTE
jgi:hypothetical protein